MQGFAALLICRIYLFIYSYYLFSSSFTIDNILYIFIIYVRLDGLVGNAKSRRPAKERNRKYRVGEASGQEGDTG